MEVSESKIREYSIRFTQARTRLLIRNGFYGLLLMHMKLSLSKEHETAWHDNDERIFINPDFIDSISDEELDYVLSHVLLHVALNHIERQEGFDKEQFYEAADIVVNSNILRARDGDELCISLRAYGGVQPNTVPNGEPGWKYSVEEVYGMLGIPIGEECEETGKGGLESYSNESQDDGEECGDDSGDADEDGSDEEGEGSGFDKGKEGEDGGSGKGEEEKSSHFPKVEEGKGGSSGKVKEGKSWDYHPGENEQGDGNTGREIKKEKWKSLMIQAAEAVEEREGIKERGTVPAFIKRYLEQLKNPQIDWRTVLDEFIQEEINDYSFCPPDRRFDDCPFFLPDFNEKDYVVKKILFMIDTSGSMSDKEVTTCYSEIKGAIDQFNGKLEGWLGFFDAVVVEPKGFADEDEFRMIRPEGGGGTSFKIIFEYIRDFMADDPPVSVIILTDGYAPFPDSSAAMDIPVLWVLTTEDVQPPWGKTARIKTGE